MAKEAALPLFVLLVVYISLGGTMTAAGEQKTWCVAKPSSEQAALQDNINYACSQPQVDCNAIQKDCPCFNPDNLMNHASVVMNLYYISQGRNYWNCYFKGSGLIVLTDPSYGSCKYP